jgi:hypothetical protein
MKKEISLETPGVNDVSGARVDAGREEEDHPVTGICAPIAGRSPASAGISAEEETMKLSAPVATATRACACGAQGERDEVLGARKEKVEATSRS